MRTNADTPHDSQVARDFGAVEQVVREIHEQGWMQPADALRRRDGRCGRLNT